MDGHLFLCHNSADKPTVESLAEALLERFSVQCWIDIWGIPAASDWQAEIERALSSCAAATVILGPAGWGPFHIQEARWLAAREGLVVIPICLPGWRAEDAAAVPELFAHRQRVEMSIPPSEEDVQRVNSALSGRGVTFPLGRPWVSPTVLRREARLWASDRHASKLLRGRKLAEARRTAERYPEQLDQQAQRYLDACSRAEIRRSRRWTAAAVGLTLVAAVVAWWTWRQARIATSDARVAQARLVAQTDTSQALELAAQAGAAFETPRVRQLRTDLALIGPPSTRVTQVRWAALDLARADGWLAVGHDGRLRSQTDREGVDLAVGNLRAVAPRRSGGVVAIGVRGLAFQDETGAVTTRPPPEGCQRPRHIAAHPERDVMAVACVGAVVIMTGSGAIEARVALPDIQLDPSRPPSAPWTQQIAWHRSGEFLLVTAAGGAWLVRPSTGGVHALRGTTAGAFDPEDGVWLAQSNQEVHWLPIGGERPHQRLVTGAATPGVIALSADGRHVVVGDDTGMIRAFPRRRQPPPVRPTHPWMTLRGHTQQITDALFLSDDELLTSSYDETIRTWRINSPRVPVVAGALTRQVVSAFSPDGRRAFADHLHAIIDLDAGTRTALAVAIGRANAAVFDANGHLVTGTQSGHLHWWAADGTVRAHHDGHQGAVTDLARLGDRIVSVGHDGTVNVWSGPGERAAEWTIDERAHAVAADARRDVIAVLASSRWYRFDAAGHRLMTGRLAEEALGDIEFMADGRLVTMQSGDRSARIWSADGRSDATLDLPRRSATTLAPLDGAFAIGSESGYVQVYAPDGSRFELGPWGEQIQTIERVADRWLIATRSGAIYTFVQP